MKVIVLYRANSSHAQSAEEFIRNLSSRDYVELEALDVDSIEGGRIAELYDIVRYPAVLVIRSDGNLQKLWQDEQLPLIDEVMSYTMA